MRTFLRERDHADPYRAIVHDTHWREIMKTRRTRVYVAGPYSKGDPVLHTRRAIEVGTMLLERGYAPFVPHLTMFWHLLTPQPYETWLAYDLEWVAACDVTLRLDGESSGADREVALTHKIGHTTYWSLDTLFAGVEATVNVSA